MPLRVVHLPVPAASGRGDASHAPLLLAVRGARLHAAAAAFTA
jgi:hypothetical protein